MFRTEVSPSDAVKCQIQDTHFGRVLPYSEDTVSIGSCFFFVVVYFVYHLPSLYLYVGTFIVI